MRSSSSLLRATLALLLLTLASCRFDDTLAGDIDITCGPNGECPQGWECIAATDRCRQIGSDAPGLESSDIKPTIGKKGTVFTITLKTTKALSRPPTIGPLGFEFQEALSNRDEFTWVFTYTATGEEKEGPFRLTGELKDASGNTANVPVGVLSLDFTAPLPIAGSMKVVPGVARPTQTVLLQIDFDEVLRDGATLQQPLLGVDGLFSNVKNTNTLAFRFTVPPEADSGQYGFTITHIADLAGNEAEDITAASPLSIESLLTVDAQAPVLEDLVLNRENFSRAAGFDEIVLTFKAGTDAVAVASALGSTPLNCATTGTEGTNNLWRCTHTVSTADTEGVKTIRTTAVDLAGNTSAETRPVTLDFTPPSPVTGSMRITPAIATVGETVVTQLNFNEILAPGAQLQQPTLQINNLASAVENNVAVAFTFTIPIGVGDGDYGFTMTGVRDLAGNVATVPPLEKKLTIDSMAPVISNLQFNAANRRYSRNTGFNEVIVTFTVSEPNALAAARIGSELMNCTAPTATTRRCALTVGPNSIEGIAAVQIEVRDAVGNNSTSNQVVTFDFTAPRVAQGTLQKTLVPFTGSLLTQVTALAGNAEAIVTFSLTEAVASAPVLKLGGQSFTCTADELSYSCVYSHRCASLADGSYGLALSVTDEVGNAFSGNPLASLTITTDCLAPLPPDTEAADAVVWHRAPYGATWSSGRIGSRLELAGDAVAESVALVRVGADVGNGTMAPLASGPFTVGTPTVIEVTDQVDRIDMLVQSIDGAGNASPLAPVETVITTVALRGSFANGLSPGLFRSDVDDDVLRAEADDRWQSDTETTTRLKARRITTPNSSYGQLMISLPNDKALMYGVIGCLVWNGAKNLWEPVKGLLPSLRGEEELARLPDGRVLMFGGRNAQNNSLTTDTWVFTAATQTWSQIAGAQPPARSGHHLVPVGTRSALLFGGTRGGLPYGDTWLFDGTTNLWRQIQGTHPVGRVAHLMATLGNGNVLVFGGSDYQTGNLTDTWVFNAENETWSQVTIGATPPDQSGRVLTTMSDGSLLMFGGPNGPAPSQNTWLFTESNGWALANVSTEPPLVSDHQLTPLPDGRVLLFGGAGASGFVNSTWVYDSKVPEWRPIPAGPGPRYTHSMVALTSGDALMFGSKNITDEVWRFNGTTETWQMVADDVPQSAGGSLVAVATHRAMLSGDYNPTSTATYLFSPDTNLWSNVNSTALGLQRYATLVPLSNGNVMLTQGSDENSQPVNETWVFDATNDTWSQSVGALPSRDCCSTLMPLDTGGVLQVGGSDRNGMPFRSSWLWQGTDWAVVPGAQPRGGATNPLAKLTDGRVLAFGGYSLGYNGESWVYSPTSNQWTATTGTLPAARQQHAMATLANNRVLMFGGEGPGTWQTTTWIYSGATDRWTELNTPSPAGLFSARMHTIEDDKVLVVGGSTPNGVSERLLLFDGTSQTWATLDSPLLGALEGFSSTDIDDKRVILYGGSVGGSDSRDTWVLETHGGAMAATGFVSLAQLGLKSTEIESLSARATAGADGFSLDNQSTVKGLDLQLYRSSETGPLFSTCATSKADAASPANVSCTAVPFARSSHVALRLAPDGFSNARATDFTVVSAELDVRSRIP